MHICKRNYGEDQVKYHKMSYSILSILVPNECKFIKSLLKQTVPKKIELKMKGEFHMEERASCMSNPNLDQRQMLLQ